ncbi:MAG: hypothetical protein V3U50_05330 [Acidimicrobiia bacterium]
MNDFDDRLRQLVRTIGEAAPPPPQVPDLPPPARRVSWRGPLIALAAFAMAIVVFGVARLLFSPGSETSGDTGLVTVRQQVVEITLVAELSCDQPVGAGTSTLRIETWADFGGGRFRQLATYSDGSVRDRIALGDLNYPTETYAKGQSGLVVPACGDDLLAGDPTSGPNVMFFNPPTESPNAPGYRQLGTIVPGEHADSTGRPALLYSQVIDGSGVAGDGTEFQIHQVTDWYVDEATGDVLEKTFEQTAAGRYEVLQTIVVTADEVTEIDPATLSTDSYQQEWSGDDGSRGLRIDAEPVQPSLRLGSSAIWPEPLEFAGSRVLARRFAEEVLGWHSAVITLDPEAGADAPTWVTLVDGQGYELEILVTPVGADGWGIFQIGDPTGLGVAPLGYASIAPEAVPAATQATIHVADSQGATKAWRADVAERPGIIVLPNFQASSVHTLLVTYQDADGYTVAASGGQFGP